MDNVYVRKGILVKTAEQGWLRMELVIMKCVLVIQDTLVSYAMNPRALMTVTTAEGV
jgi:hypothetical protein